MSIQTTKYVRKPLFVDVIQVTEENIAEVATWCQGEIQDDPSGLLVGGVGSGKMHNGCRYIFVRVHSPRNPRQNKAYVGDWILYTERGYKVYTTKAFFASFELVEPSQEESTDSPAPTEEVAS